MKKSSKNDNAPSEAEIRLCFYGYVLGELTRDMRSYKDPEVSEFRAPNNINNPILCIPLDKELLVYSILGLESMEIFSTEEELLAIKKTVNKLIKRLL